MKDMGHTNSVVYQSKSIVASYACKENLQPAEQSILREIKDSLKPMTMLDIGVGAGRTTIHFAPLVKEYMGIDYSHNMIEVCKSRFANLSFQTVDVRQMEIFKDNTFDFILFSYNGIDCISHEDRTKALMEIKRVAKQGSLFCFSTHHLGYIKNFMKVSWNEDIVRVIQRYYQAKEILKSHRPYGIIRDGGGDFQLHLYYIKPSEQVKTLQQMGFRDVRIFSKVTGKETTDFSKLDDCSQEGWLYYLCRIEK